MPHYTNRLRNETSPYLLQHAHNPVDWFPWGEEALQKAVAEDKPILVSIGYAACHWCHVMERESFEHPDTAEIMNRHFVNIKVDREERPDLDHIYMDAVQAITGSGGWPLNVFLTPDRKPFFGGTYFPPLRMHNRASWKEVLTNIATAYRNRRDEIEEQANQLVGHLEQSNAFGPGRSSGFNIPFEEKFTRQHTRLMAEQLLKSADRKWGGFGRAPKFPQTFSIQFLLRYHYYFDEPDALAHARLSLIQMIHGGIYDQIGGGFARYSTDTEWLAPHFEKMTYDNALLISVLCEAFQMTKEPFFEHTIHHTLAFMEREMLGPEGGFYAALDADSEGVEGKFYTWSLKELREILGAEAEWAGTVFDISDEGNWEHTNIPRMKKTVGELAEQMGTGYGELQKRIDDIRRVLLARRAERVRPQTDDKILLGWNALMNTALCQAFVATGKTSYLELAERNMDFLYKNLHDSDGHFWHTWKSGKAKVPAFLDDYAFLIASLTTLHEVTGSKAYLDKAAFLTEHVLAFFSDEGSPYFFYTPHAQQDAIVRKKEIYDGAQPSGNAVMAWNLHRLGILTGRPEWKIKAVAMAEAMTELAMRYPGSFGCWAGFILELVNGTHEILVLGEKAIEEGRRIMGLFIPNKVIQCAASPDDLLPMQKDKLSSKNLTIYLCKDYACKMPVYSTDELVQLIELEKKR
jgi:hypothetical protein